jgi:hypothetical protein
VCDELMVAHSRAVGRKSLESPWVDAAIVRAFELNHSSCHKIELPIFLPLYIVDVTPFHQELAYFVFVPVAASSH